MSAAMIALVATQLSGSLRLDGVLTRPADWTKSGAGTDPAVVTTSDPSGLRVTSTATRYPGHDALLWRSTVSFDAAGESDSPLLSDLLPLDLALPTDGIAVVSSVNGSRCRLDDFLPWRRELSTDQDVQVEPVGGRSSDTAAPFFVVELGSTSVAVAIGWSGQWAFRANQDDGSVRLRAGQADVSLRLHPGESISQPSIMVVEATGGAERASNALRRVLEEQIIPHHGDGSVVTPMAHMTMSSFHRQHTVSEASEIAAVARTAELGLEAFWMDACWYGDSPLWAEQVGNWHVRTPDFPRGLRPVSDAAHDAGLDFVFWMEPERARQGTQLVQQHPDLFLAFPAGTDPQGGNVLLDLGRPEAQAIALDLISGFITEFAADVYRQDFNIAPLAAWRAADEPDRHGLHEIRHVEGLYRLWDQLLERHPGLVIDNCASGGRRIDLETLHRSVPLWRSDAADVGGGAEGDDVSLANQRQVAGLGRFVTQHTGPIWAFDPYSTRSALGTGFVVYCPLPTAESAANDLRAAVAETARCRPATTGDLHVITPDSVGEGWSVLQFHRNADDGHDVGVLVVLRRPGSGESQVTLEPIDIDPSDHYRVTLSPSYERGAEQVITGDQLATIAVTIGADPGSMLVEYARLP